MMAATRRPAWSPATGASTMHSDDSADYCFISEATGSTALLAQDPSFHADVPPNPPFTFPARLSSPSSAPALYGSRRPMSVTESQRSISPSSENVERPRKTLALPAFNFNPGASLAHDPDSISLSLPISPNTPSSRPFPSPIRPTRHGHRRGGSEFVGGSIRDGNSIAVMSTSPTKSDSGFAPSCLAPPPRGHRRVMSGTVGASDLPFLRPLPGYKMLRGNSAPNSPTSFELKKDALAALQCHASGSNDVAHATEDGTSTDDAARPTTPTMISLDADGSSPKLPRSGRTRVGFSDKLEFIPRPLSMVSSDTSSTATARPGHSVSGSISSVISVASPCDRESPATRSRKPSIGFGDARPHTAGAILERMAAPPKHDIAQKSPRRRNSNPTLMGVSEAQAAEPNNPVATVKARKRWSFFGLESTFGSPVMSTKPRSLSSSSCESVSRTASAPSSSDHESDSTETGRDLNISSTDKQGRKKMSRKRMVKGWAGSILPLKPRGQRKPSRTDDLRPPTPPASVDPLEDDEVDETGDIESSEASETEATSVNGLDAKSPTPERELVSPHQLCKDDMSHSMIDLDAALGPFNTPLPHNAEWEAAQRAAGTTGKRRMHSAQGMKGFSGPGMHYHRRSESAPDLPPFDPGRFSIHCLNSTLAMADVFEEDEDGDDVAVAHTLSRKLGAASVAGIRGSGTTMMPAAVLASVETSPPTHLSPTESVAPIQKRASSEPIESSANAAKSLTTNRPMSSARRCEATVDPPSIIFCGTPANDVDSVPSSPKRHPGFKDTTFYEYCPANYGSALANPLSPCLASLASSSHPSPRSPISVDAQRMSTASSSVTDKNSFQSLLMGEPGPEVRISADYDMRSLTSSNSTMTRDSSFVSSQAASQKPALRDQRPVSVSSAAFGRRQSSLMSLSRLISSAHGERSKLSMEVTLDNEVESKKTRFKGGKTKERLGRMMQFWKPAKGGAPA